MLGLRLLQALSLLDTDSHVGWLFLVLVVYIVAIVPA